MNFDISLCSNNICNIKDKCYRYLIHLYLQNNESNSYVPKNTILSYVDCKNQSLFWDINH
jgi:hypothetical protein